MSLKVDDRPDPARWDTAVAAAGGTVFQSSAWAHHVQVEQPSARPLFMTLLSEGGAALGYALGFQQQSPRPLLAHLDRRVWLDAAPLAAREDTGTFLTLIEAHAKGLRAVELHIGSFASPDIGRLLEQRAFRCRGRIEFELSLAGSEAEMFHDLGGVRRQTIRKAQRHGVQVSQMSDPAGLAELRRLQVESATRIAARGGPALTPGAHGNQHLQALIALGVGRLFVARLGEEIVSAGFFTYFNGLAYYAMAGHAREGLRVQAPALLLWDATQFHKELGATRFNLGGCSADAAAETSSEHGVYIYKKDFNGRILTCTSGAKILRPGAHRALGLLRTTASALGVRASAPREVK